MKANNFDVPKIRTERPQQKQEEVLIKDRECIGCEHLCDGCKGKPRNTVCINYKERKDRLK